MPRRMSPDKYLEWVAREVAPKLVAAMQHVLRATRCCDQPVLLEVPWTTDHPTVPVMAMYPESEKTREYHVEVLVDGKPSLRAYKPKGHWLVPLIGENDALVVKKGAELDVAPRPETLIVFEIRCTGTRETGEEQP